MPVSVRSRRKGRTFALESLTGKSQEAPRLSSGMVELDRVTGGGFVRGSVLLVGGDPGIGKSTLLIQAAAALARAGHRAVYISGEEAVARSEEHTSELQSHSELVCRLLLEKKKGAANRPQPRA